MIIDTVLHAACWPLAAGSECRLQKETNCIPRRVAIGAYLLDYFAPNWWDAIDQNMLDVGKMTRCVLTQLFGDFYDAPWILRTEWMGNQVRFGFMEPSSLGYDAVAYYKTLTAEWLRVIRARKAAASEVAQAAFFIDMAMLGFWHV